MGSYFVRFDGLLLQGVGVGHSMKMGPEYNQLRLSGVRRNNALVAMTMGSSDFNRWKLKDMQEALGSERLKVWDWAGGHAWAPKSAAELALDWLLRERGL